MRITRINMSVRFYAYTHYNVCKIILITQRNIIIRTMVFNGPETHRRRVLAACHGDVSRKSVDCDGWRPRHWPGWGVRPPNDRRRNPPESRKAYIRGRRRTHPHHSYIARSIPIGRLHIIYVHVRVNVTAHVIVGGTLFGHRLYFICFALHLPRWSSGRRRFERTASQSVTFKGRVR